MAGARALEVELPEQLEPWKRWEPMTSVVVGVESWCVVFGFGWSGLVQGRVFVLIGGVEFCDMERKG
jgi:hypothetical protein